MRGHRRHQDGVRPPSPPPPRIRLPGGKVSLGFGAESFITWGTPYTTTTSHHHHHARHRRVVTTMNGSEYCCEVKREEMMAINFTIFAAPHNCKVKQRAPPPPPLSSPVLPTYSCSEADTTSNWLARVHPFPSIPPPFLSLCLGE